MQISISPGDWWSDATNQCVDCFIQTSNQMKSTAWLQQMWRHLDCCDCWWSIARCCVTQRDTAWQSWRVARGTKTDGLHTPAAGRGRGQGSRRHNGTNLMLQAPNTKSFFELDVYGCEKRFEGGFPSVHTHSRVQSGNGLIEMSKYVRYTFHLHQSTHQSTDSRVGGNGKWFISPVRKRENCCKNFWS